MPIRGYRSDAKDGQAGSGSGKNLLGRICAIAYGRSQQTAEVFGLMPMLRAFGAFDLRVRYLLAFAVAARCDGICRRLIDTSRWKREEYLRHVSRKSSRYDCGGGAAWLWKRSNARAMTSATQTPTTKGTSPHMNSCGMNITTTAGHGATPPSPTTTLGDRNTARMTACTTIRRRASSISFDERSAVIIVGIHRTAKTITTHVGEALCAASTPNDTMRRANAATATARTTGDIVRFARVCSTLSNMAVVLRSQYSRYE